jgi:hypothetical protein
MVSQRKSKRTWTILLTAASVILIWGAEARAQGKKYGATFSENIVGTASNLNYVRTRNGTLEALQGPAALTFGGALAGLGSGLIPGSVIIRVYMSTSGQSGDMGFDWKVGPFTYHLTLPPQPGGTVSGSFPRSATLTFVNAPFRLTVYNGPNLISSSTGNGAYVTIRTMPQP